MIWEMEMFEIREQEAENAPGKSVYVRVARKGRRR